MLHKLLKIILLLLSVNLNSNPVISRGDLSIKIGKEEVISDFYTEYKPDNSGGVYRVESGLFVKKIYFDDSMNLKKMDVKIDAKEMVSVLGFDKQEIEYDLNNNVVEIKYFYNGEKSDIKKLKVTDDFIVMDSLFLYLEKRGSIGPNPLKSNIILPEQGIVAKAQISESRISDLGILLGQYDIIPDFFKFNDSGELIVYEMRFKGFVGLLFPHRFYFVYNKDRRFKAYFGGNPKEPQFWIINR